MPGARFLSRTVERTLDASQPPGPTARPNRRNLPPPASPTQWRIATAGSATLKPRRAGPAPALEPVGLPYNLTTVQEAGVHPSTGTDSGAAYVGASDIVQGRHRAQQCLLDWRSAPVLGVATSLPQPASMSISQVPVPPDIEPTEQETSGQQQSAQSHGEPGAR